MSCNIILVYNKNCTFDNDSSIALHSWSLLDEKKIFLANVIHCTNSKKDTCD